MAWVRVDTQTILSIHHNVITQNPRIWLSYNDHRSWFLHIRNVHEADRGWYMCQVNTDPMRSRQGYLQVVGKYTPQISHFIWKLNRWQNETVIRTEAGNIRLAGLEDTPNQSVSLEKKTADGRRNSMNRAIETSILTPSKKEIKLKGWENHPIYCPGLTPSSPAIG